METIKFQQNIPLSGFTTFRIGGPARYFFSAKTEQELIGAAKWAKEKNLPCFVFGGGSNILFSEKGFEGLVVKNELANFASEENGEKMRVKCGAGVLFGDLILKTAFEGYSGAEWGFGIPGTVGGAICGNAGRLGQSISQIVLNVDFLDADLAKKNLDASLCGFGYRRSRFKKTGEIILGAVLEFEKKDQSMIDEIFNQAKKIADSAPDLPSAGCAFKNYVVRENDFLLSCHPELEKKIRGGKIGVGFLIEQCGLKGAKIGGAQIWENHANYIVNAGNAKSNDVLDLIKICKEKVKEKFGVELEEEIRIIR